MGHIRLADDDLVELSNLHRQVLYLTRDVGRPKVEAAAERLRERVPAVEVEAIRARVDRGNVAALLAGVDVVVDATDDPGAGFLLNDAALAAGVGAVLGGVIRFEGTLLAVPPGRGPCYRCLFEDAPEPGEVATCGTAGVLGAMAGLVGHLQAERALGLLGGEGAVAQHTGFVTTVDGLRGRVRRVPVPVDPRCPACGGAGAGAEGRP